MADWPVHAKIDGPIVMIGFGSIGKGILQLQGPMAFLIWSTASVPGAIAVIVFKGMLSNLFRGQFERQWLLFQWWGAGEREHPATMPPKFYHAAEAWVAYHRAEEMAESTGATRWEQTRAMRTYARAIGGDARPLPSAIPPPTMRPPT